MNFRFLSEYNPSCLNCHCRCKSVTPVVGDIVTRTMIKTLHLFAENWKWHWMMLLNWHMQVTCFTVRTILLRGAKFVRCLLLTVGPTHLVTHIIWLNQVGLSLTFARYAVWLKDDYVFNSKNRHSDHIFLYILDIFAMDIFLTSLGIKYHCRVQSLLGTSMIHFVPQGTWTQGTWNPAFNFLSVLVSRKLT